MAGKAGIIPDHELWLEAVRQISQELKNLAPLVAAEVKNLIGELISTKSAMHAVVERSAGAATCAECGGKCCTCGRYHFAVIDLVAYLVSGKALFTPNFTGANCLFLQGDNCLMPPGYRPFNCITFACESIERNFAGSDKDLFYAMERELRLLYQRLQQCLPDPRMGRSVLSFMQTDGS